MSRTPKPAQAEKTTSAEAAGEAPVTTLKDVPILTALLGVVQAMLAVARFPSSPMPVALTDRLSAAQQEFIAALDAPMFPSMVGAPEQVGGYDDTWARDKFSSLEGALKERFAAVDSGHQTLSETLTSLSNAVGEVNARLVEIEGFGLRLAELERARSAASAQA